MEKELFGKEGGTGIREKEKNLNFWRGNCLGRREERRRKRTGRRKKRKIGIFPEQVLGEEGRREEKGKIGKI